MNDLFHSFKEPTRTKELRPYQQDAIAKVRQSLVRKNRKIVVQLPTGAGKTLTAAKIIEGALAKGNRVIFTAPAVSLIDQTVEAFEAEGIRDIGVMQADHPRTDARARVQQTNGVVGRGREQARHEIRHARRRHELAESGTLLAVEFGGDV